MLMAVKEPGFDGEDMTLRPLTRDEIGPKSMGTPGYDEKLNHETRKRKFVSRFHKNIANRWNEKQKSRILAAELYFLLIEKAESGFSHGAYEDTPPPKFYSPRTMPSIGRIKAAETLNAVHESLTPLQKRVIRSAICESMTVSEIYYRERGLAKKSKATSYREGWKIINAAFDRLAEILEGI